MNLGELKYCPGTLAEGFNTYSPSCLRNLFNGKKVNHLLPYEQPQQSEEVAEQFMENRKRISISGVQEKLSFLLEKNLLRLTNEGEHGTYILKPIPRDLKKVDQVPANEHLTMQIAKQVYGLNTAENAMIFFKNGSPAYITKRFDVKEDGSKWGKEDFATLAGKTKDNAGANFKYEYSYEEVGMLIQKYVPAWRVEIEKYFSLVVFNFLFSNGDAHLKNFSLLESTKGDYLLSPAYDLVNTKLHVDDSDFALDKGLFADGFKSEQYKKSEHPSKSDFTEFAKRIGVAESRVNKLIYPFLENQPYMETLVSRSFLSDANKRGYLLMYNTKRNYLIA
ncbi:MAG: HipA domain-containing protein [Saprospiraceae bacterium]|jgi:serine/threonine-protein kinase HipA|nr:HipA domain-containing protein [Saprospiraceae bacterium]MBK7795529.1 HipA domain-containing protein [Saprospiraceae bacterium]MBK9379071.1 HipA domain-containing protein [Saprospiraceae bacterium]MBL0260637.1 HipA domain-containing protein [Saprospiraceae bacterium]